MRRPSGQAAVRLTLWMLVAAVLSHALVQPAQAGTEANPEIQDPANDHTLSPAGHDVTGLGSACGSPAPCLNRIDILSVWIDQDTATQFNVNVALSNAPVAASEYNSNYEFHATFGGKEVVAKVGTDTSGPIAGDNVAAVAADGNTLIVTILKSVYGAGPTGDLTDVFVVGIATAGASGTDSGQELATDRAPDADGITYAMGGGAGGGNGTSDNQLNATCKAKYFPGNSTANATGDPDHDGLSNGQECALGTDPTKADTDGDGCDDKNDTAPSDPAAGCSSGSGNSTSTSSSSSGSGSHSSSTSTSSSHSSSTTSSATGSNSKGAPKDLNEAMDRLGSNAGYLGLSSGGFLAVLVLCIIGLAVRWSL